MNKKDIFPSKYVSAADLPEAGAVVTISTISTERMMDGQEKPIASFVEQRLPNGEKLKDMVINVTKWNTIAKMYGDESDDWHGKRISIRPGEVKMKGEMVACIDVSSKKPGSVSPSKREAPKGSQEAEEAIAAAAMDGLDDPGRTVPF